MTRRRRAGAVVSASEFLSHIRSPRDGQIALAVALWGAELGAPEWHEQAACAGTPMEWWHRAEAPAPRDHGGWPGETTAARAELCASCPVRRLCADDTERWERTSPFGAIHGYVAGQSPADRNKAAQSTRKPITTYTSDRDNHAA